MNFIPWGMEWIEFDTDVRDDKHWLNGRIPRIVFIFIQTVGQVLKS